MSAIFLKKEPPKNTNVSHLKDRYFVMGGLINMNVGII